MIHLLISRFQLPEMPPLKSGYLKSGGAGCQRVVGAGPVAGSQLRRLPCVDLSFLMSFLPIYSGTVPCWQELSQVPA